MMVLQEGSDGFCKCSSNVHVFGGREGEAWSVLVYGVQCMFDTLYSMLLLDVVLTEPKCV